jgi:Outer membrane protein beta-barrel domain
MGDDAMKRFIWLIPVALILFFSAPARAQSTPAWDLSGGYSYLRADLNGSSFQMNGGFGSVSENLNRWFGGRLEVAGFTGTFAAKSISAQTFTYGPVFSYRKHEGFTPFAHVQFGAIHGSVGYLGISAPAWKFAMAGGVGADVKLKGRLGLRFQADYLMTRFLSLRQDNIQASVGLVYRFGSK